VASGKWPLRLPAMSRRAAQMPGFVISLISAGSLWRTTGICSFPALKMQKHSWPHFQRALLIWNSPGSIFGSILWLRAWPSWQRVIGRHSRIRADTSVSLPATSPDWPSRQTRAGNCGMHTGPVQRPLNNVRRRIPNRIWRTGVAQPTERKRLPPLIRRSTIAPACSPIP
jgi:hypothetical protein